MDKILTISIAAYNSEAYLGRCLESILEISSLDALEIIIVNDGSKDGTLSVAKYFEKKYSNVVSVINKMNGGHGSTINASVECATGKYFKIVDSDDTVDSMGLEYLINVLKHSSADMIVNPYYIVHEDIPAKEIINPFSKDGVFNIETPIAQNPNLDVTMHSITYLTQIVKSLDRKIDENCFYVDMEFVVFPMIYVHSVLCLEYPIYKYHIGREDQSMSQVNLIDRRKQHLKVIKSLTDYYVDNKKELISGVDSIILRRIKNAVASQYIIYLWMKEVSRARTEIIEFDKWLKGMDLSVYSGPDRKIMKLVKIFRITRFVLYTPIVWMLHLLNINIQM